MKRILTILVLLIAGIAIGQPIVNRSGIGNTVADSRWQATLNAFIPRYADTTSANTSKGIDSAGAIIYTYSTNALWYRQSSPKKWVQLASSGFAGTVTNVSATSLSPLFTTFVANPTTTPAIEFTLSNAAPNTYFGRLTGTGVPSFIANSNMVIPCSPSATKISSTKIVVTKCPSGGTDTVTVAGGIESFYFISDSTMVVCHPPTQVCDTIFNANPQLPYDSIVCRPVQVCDTISLGSGFKTTGYVFQNGLTQVSPWIIEQGGYFNRDTRISGRLQYSFTYDSLNFFVRGPFGAGQRVTAYTGSQMFFSPRKAAFRMGQSTHNFWIEDSIGAYSIAMGANVYATGPYGVWIGGTSNYNSVNLGTGIGGVSNAIRGARGLVFGGELNYIPVNSYSAAAINALSSIPFGHFTTVSGEYIKVYSRDGWGIGAYNDTTDSGGATSTLVNTRRLFQIGNGISYATRSNALTVYADRGKMVIGGVGMDSASQLRLTATSLGFAVNKGTGAQMNAIVSPYDGLLYWATDSLGLCEYVSSLGGWKKVDRSGGGGGGSGTVTAVTAGNGMNFSTITTTGSVTLGTGSTVTLATTNSVSGTTHSHAFDLGGTASQVLLGNNTLTSISSLSTAPGGSNTQMQYNNSGAFGGTAGATADANYIYVDTLYGGTGAAQNLTFISTSNASKGNIYFGNSNYMRVDQANSSVAIGYGATTTATPLAIKSSSGSSVIRMTSTQTGTPEGVFQMQGNGSGNPYFGLVYAPITSNSGFSLFSNTGGTRYLFGDGATGRFGFNTTSLSQAVTVSGSFKVTDSVIFSGLPTASARFRFLTIDASGIIYASDTTGLYGGGGGGGGGGGTVTQVNSAYGILGGPITLTGTLLLDTATVFTQLFSTFSLTTTGTFGAATWNPTTRILNIPQYSGGGGSGTVTDFIFTDANGFDGTVSTSTTTPTLSLTTTVTDTRVMYSNAGAIAGMSGVTSDGTNMTAASNNLRATSPRFTTGINDASGNELFLFTATASAINELAYANAATGNYPRFTASGGDTDIGFDFLTKAAGTFNLVGNSTQAATIKFFEDTDDGVNYTSFRAGTQSSNAAYTLPTGVPAANGYLLSSTTAGVMSWVAPGAGSGTVTDFVFTDGNGFDGTVTTSTSTPTLSLTTTVTTTQVMYSNSGAIAGVSGFTSNGTGVTASSGNLTATRPKFITSIDDTNGNELFGVTATASAVNEFTVANAATGNNPIFSATGGDANVGLNFLTKGTGGFGVMGNSTQAGELRIFEDSDDGTNYSAFKATAQSANLTYTLPNAYPAVSGYVLSSNTSGTMSWVAGGGGGGSTAISALTVATATNGIDNGDFSQVWRWNTLSSGAALFLESNSTAASATTPILFDVSMYGANSSSTRTTISGRFANTHTGTASTNIGVQINASGGTSNYALIIPAGNVGIGNSTPSQLFVVGENGGLGGKIGLSGSTTGLTSIQVAATTSNTTYTWPSTAPASNGLILASQTDGTMSWTAASSGTVSNFIFTDGNGFDGTVSTATTTPTLSLTTTVTNTQVMYSNSGAIAGMSGVTSDGTNMTAGSDNLRATAPRITTSIDDANGNELFIVTATASAVNEVTFANGAAGSYPRFTASGSDTDIGFEFLTKAAGTFNFVGSSTQAATVKFFEDTDDGANYSSIRAGAQAGNINYTLPTTAPSSNGYVLSSTTGGAMSWIAAGGTGTVTDFIFTDANGFDGTVTSSSTTPTLSITTTVTDTRVMYSSAGAIAGMSGVTSDGTNMTAGSGNFRATKPRFTTSIDDANGNETFIVTATTSAVNEFTVINAATGANPQFNASGGDLNIGIDFTPKGTGVFQFIATSSNAATIRLFEDTDDGANYSSFKSPALAANVNYTLPTTDGNNLEVLQTDGSGGLTWAAVTSGTVTSFAFTDGNGFDGTVSTATTTPTLSLTTTVTDTRVMYSNAGAIAGMSGVTSDGTNMTAGSGNLRATSPRITTSLNDVNGNELFIFTAAGSAVNEITYGNANAGSNPSLTMTGSSANIGLDLQLKGSGILSFFGTSSNAATMYFYEDTDNGTNFTSFKVGIQSADIAYTLPTTDGNSGEFLQTDGAGVLSWVAAGGSGTVTSFTFTDGSGFDGTVTNSTTTPTLSLTTTVTNTQLMYSASGAITGISGATSNGTAVTFSSANLLATRPRFTTSIDDANGNESFVLTATASAVNEITFANAATGANPTFTASGGDANVGIDFLTKATGVFQFLGSTTQAAIIRLFEDADDGTNYTSFKSPALAANVNYTLPANDGDNLQFLQTDGSGGLTWAAGGSGTVTSFSAGNLSPLFTTSVATATSTPALTFTLSNAASGTVLGNTAGSSQPPTYTADPTLGIANTTEGSLTFFSATSGSAKVRVTGSSGNYNFNLPLAAGTAGQVLTSQAGGTSAMTWTTPTTGTVTTFAFTDGSGFDGTVSTATTTPTLSLTTTITNTKLMYSNSGALADITGASSDGTSVTFGSANLLATRPKFTTSVDDANGNEIFVFTATASAVNELTIANAATGANPKFTASGGDANIGMDLLMKGTGVINFLASASNAATLRLYEDSDDGTNYTSFKSPTLAANVDYTLPINDGDNLQFLQTNGSGVLSWVAAGSGTVTSFTFTDGSGFDGTVTNSTTTPTLALTTTLTAGSVAFIAAAGALAQDNNNFFWDDTNNRLGIGTTAAPAFVLDVIGTVAEIYLTSFYNASTGGSGAYMKINSNSTDYNILTLEGSTAVRFQVKSNGSVHFNSDAGSSGYTLQSAGVGGPPTWVNASTQTITFTNKRITQRVGTTASSATPTPDADANDAYTVTALAAGATFGAPTGTPTDLQPLIIRIKDNGTARTLAWNAIYRASSDLALPTTTVISKTMYLKFIYCSADSKWDFVAYLNNF